MGDQIGIDNPFSSSPTEFLGILPPLQDNFNFNSIPMTTEGLLTSSQADSSRRSTPSVSRMKRFYFLIPHSSQKYGTLGGLAHIFLVLPPLSFLALLSTP